MTTRDLLHPLIPLLIVPACLADSLELGETTSETTVAVAPIDTFEIRADRLVYLGNDGSGVRAYELDQDLLQVRKSPAIESVSKIENLTTDGDSVLFGDGTKNVRLSLAGSGVQAFDSFGVFEKSLRGIGGVTLRDGTLARLINGNGFGVETSSPIEVFSGAQATAVPVLSEGARAYIAPAGYQLRYVNVDKKTSLQVCKSGTAYATTKSLVTAHDQEIGAVRVLAKRTDGTLVDCRYSAKGQQLQIVDLPWKVGDVAYEGGGGLAGFDGGGGIKPNEDTGFDGGGGIIPNETGFDGGGGLGIWVTAADKPELAYVSAAGKVVIIPLTDKLGITPIPIPRVVRSFSDGSAVVLMSNQQFVRVERPL